MQRTNGVPFRQVVTLLQLFSGGEEKRLPEEAQISSSSEEEAGSSSREEAFIAVFSRITDESNLDL